jgi:hypothetical protein
MCSEPTAPLGYDDELTVFRGRPRACICSKHSRENFPLYSARFTE